MRLLIVAANARSLIANRGDLIRELKARGVGVTAAVPTRDWLPEVERLGIDLHPIAMGRTGVNPLQDVRTVFALLRLMRRLKPDAVFSYSAKPVIYGSLAARLAGVPGVYSMITGLGHAYTTQSVRTRLIRFVMTWLYRAGLACSHRVFFQNPDDLQEFVDRRIIRDQRKVVRINGSGIDLERFARQPLPEGPPVFLFIGRLLTEKGIAEFAAAAQSLAGRWPQARFVAVGPHDPGLPHAVKAEALAAWKRAGVVEFVGGVKDVRPWLAACSVFVLPSYREGTPRSVLEAMAVGRAIVTTDAPGCRETVVPGENGLLVPPRESAPLALAMERFLLEPELIPRMAEASRCLVEEKYDVRKVNAGILQAMGLS
jgi:glycosyltransferase involved in cell wall biosynthesis